MRVFVATPLNFQASFVPLPTIVILVCCRCNTTFCVKTRSSKSAALTFATSETVTVTLEIVSASLLNSSKCFLTHPVIIRPAPLSEYTPLLRIASLLIAESTDGSFECYYCNKTSEYNATFAPATCLPRIQIGEHPGFAHHIDKPLTRAAT